MKQKNSDTKQANKQTNIENETCFLIVQYY